MYALPCLCYINYLLGQKGDRPTVPVVSKALLVLCYLEFKLRWRFMIRSNITETVGG